MRQHSQAASSSPSVALRCSGDFGIAVLPWWWLGGVWWCGVEVGDLGRQRHVGAHRVPDAPAFADVVAMLA